MLNVFTARHEETNALTGYAIFFVKHNLHYSTSLQAIQDVLYIDQKQRGFGAKFILWCDQELKKLGVQAVYHHVKTKHDFGPLLKRIGYEHIDQIWGRLL